MTEKTETQEIVGEEVIIQKTVNISGDLTTLTVEELYDKDKFDLSTMEPGDVFQLLQYVYEPPLPLPLYDSSFYYPLFFTASSLPPLSLSLNTFSLFSIFFLPLFPKKNFFFLHSFFLFQIIGDHNFFINFFFTNLTP